MIEVGAVEVRQRRSLGFAQRHSPVMIGVGHFEHVAAERPMPMPRMCISCMPSVPGIAGWPAAAGPSPRRMIDDALLAHLRLAGHEFLPADVPSWLVSSRSKTAPRSPIIMPCSAKRCRMSPCIAIILLPTDAISSRVMIAVMVGIERPNSLRICWPTSAAGHDLVAHHHDMHFARALGGATGAVPWATPGGGGAGCATDGANATTSAAAAPPIRSLFMGLVPPLQD